MKKKWTSLSLEGGRRLRSSLLPERSGWLLRPARDVWVKRGVSWSMQVYVLHASFSFFLVKGSKGTHGECQHSNHLRLLFLPIKIWYACAHCVRWFSKIRKAHTGQKKNCQYVKLEANLMWTENERKRILLSLTWRYLPWTSVGKDKCRDVGPLNR